jgi:hypothetical protein
MTEDEDCLVIFVDLLFSSFFFIFYAMTIRAIALK